MTKPKKIFYYQCPDCHSSFVTYDEKIENKDLPICKSCNKKYKYMGN